MTRTNVKRHKRSTKQGIITIKGHIRKIKRPQRLGSKWRGPKYVHGPRKADPKKCEKFRVGKPTKTGKRLVFCKLKRKNKWVVQSKLTPRKR